MMPIKDNELNKSFNRREKIIKLTHEIYHIRTQLANYYSKLNYNSINKTKENHHGQNQIG